MMSLKGINFISPGLLPRKPRRSQAQETLWKTGPQRG